MQAASLKGHLKAEGMAQIKPTPHHLASLKTNIAQGSTREVGHAQVAIDALTILKHHAREVHPAKMTIHKTTPGVFAGHESLKGKINAVENPIIYIFHN